MENSMSRILIETIIKRTLRNIKDNPERGIRNLIDMALQFSEGRFQKDFFTAAQTMLQNENSAYYDLVRDVVNRTDSDRLLTFGMNLGYNGCTIGAQRIRDNEKKFHCNIPWAVTLLIDAEHFENNKQKYHAFIQDGEFLGIYVWMLFPRVPSGKNIIPCRKASRQRLLHFLPDRRYYRLISGRSFHAA